MKSITLQDNKVIKLFAVMLITLTALFGTMTIGVDTADARIGGVSTEGSQSQQRLRDAVDDSIADKSYTSKEGDTIKGSYLVKDGITTEEFSKLTSKEQQRLINEMDSAVTKQQERDNENGNSNPVTDDTKTNWLKELQQQPGVGSKLLQNITEQIKPDYVTGQRIFAPFSGPLNTLIALGVIMLMTFLAVTFVCDLSYLNIPVFQSLIANSMSNSGGGSAGRFTNFFVGREALQAIEESENNSNGKYKNPNGLYLKKRFVGIAILGLCLLYLIQGQIFALVGMLMDLLGGFLE